MTALPQPRCQLQQNLRPVRENPDVADIQSDIDDTIHQARFPCMRLCAV